MHNRSPTKNNRKMNKKMFTQYYKDSKLTSYPDIINQVYLGVCAFS